MSALHSVQTILQRMHDTLRRLDLNLLLVFDAVYRRRSVVAAADELAMSPSACSHALGRLRDAWHDELFTRAGAGMQPTPRADLIAESVAEALGVLSARLGETERFDPASSTRTVTFAATDFTAFALLPGIVSRLEKRAPNLNVKIVPSRNRDAHEELNAGRADFVLGFSDEFHPPADDIESIDAGEDDYVVVARSRHPRIRAPLSLSAYLAERHVVVAPWPEERSVIDMSLAKLGVARKVAVELPDVMAAPFIVASSDLLITFPRRAARQLATTARITVYDAPFETPRFTFRVFFQRRNLHSPWHRWMREQIEAAIRRP
jgi:DNA-binding transcriptional LysR family regulator